MTILLIAIFIAGYLAIALEYRLQINKAAIALVTGVASWTVYMLAGDTHNVLDRLSVHIGDISGILFFLLSAMTIVELIDAHDGFNILTDKIRQTDKRVLLWIISGVTFFLSPILDNLTTTIVLVSVIRKLIYDPHDRFYFIGMVVIAANAGGAWSPIGDVTTTMLWIGGQISATAIIGKVLLPSMMCVIAPLVVLSFRLKGSVTKPEPVEKDHLVHCLSRKDQLIVLCLGVTLLLAVPVFKTVTHLPPYMGILLGLGLLWVITEILHGDKDEEDRHQLSVAYALRKIDTPSILFFLGILLSVSALEAAGILSGFAAVLSAHIPHENLLVVMLGFVSSIVDNVPLVAAAQGMYGLDVYPKDHSFWEFLAYCTGTGGSLLIIGSSAGVAAMGMEKITFGWYLRNMSWLALTGFGAGAAVYLLLQG